jgi:uncharacterized protein (DUF3084 family)
MTIDQELESLKKQIADAEKNLNIQIGAEQEIMKRLQEEEGFKSVAQAENYVARERDNIIKMDQTIAAKFKTLKENYSW